jgi:hypothetical protein
MVPLFGDVDDPIGVNSEIYGPVKLPIARSKTPHFAMNAPSPENFWILSFPVSAT